MTDKPSDKLPPNIVWVFGDQHRAQALGLMGDSNLRTPNIDRLSSAATTAVAGCPLCSPFRGSLLTSRYPHRCVPGHDRTMPDGLPTVATAFREAGYQTAYFGKWHVDGAGNRENGTRAAFQTVARCRRGDFDVWLGYENNNDQYDCWIHGHDAQGNEIKHERLPCYETDSLTDLLLDYLGQCGKERANRRARPFFAALSVQPPHSPYVAPPEYLERHSPEEIQLRPNVPPVRCIQEQARRDLAGYYAMVENLDDNVGRVIDTLDKHGLREDTYVIFFSDHGDMHGSQARWLKCVPWEESIRIPFLVSRGNPACLKGAAERRDLMLNHVDIAPTSLGLCGIDTPSWMLGTDMSGYFTNDRPLPSPEPDSVYSQLVDPGFVHGFAPDRERPWRGLITSDGWKYAVLEGQPWLLYNLNEDPYETANLALDGSYRVERKRLQDRLAAWIHDTGDTFPLPDVGS